MTAHSLLGRLTATTILLCVTATVATAADRATALRTETASAAIVPPPAPAPTLAAADVLAEAELPGGAIPLASVPSPPARTETEGADLLLQSNGGGPQLRYYALDALGSVRVVFDAAGNVVGRADYEPFGAHVTASMSGTLPRQQFTGQERDGEVGSDYFGARMYLPSHGRMLSVDPIYSGAVEEPQRWNRFAYALNNPLRYVDPDGRLASECTHTESYGTITVDGVEVTGSHTTVSCNGQPAGGGGGGWGPALWSFVKDVFPYNVGGSHADHWDVPLVWHTPPRRTDPDGVNGPESNSNVTVDDLVSDVINSGAVVGGLQKPAAKTVIGKLDDLVKLAPGESTLVSRLPNLGSPKANWYQNASVLRQEMRLGRPIRDASVDPITGALLNNTGFLKAERSLLSNRLWTYDTSTQLWYPPR